MDRNNERWIADLKAQNDSALLALRERLFKNLRRALANHNRADDSFLEDIAQDALLTVLEKIDQFQGRSQFITWATSIAIRLAFAQLRRNRWKDVSLDEITAGPNTPFERAVDESLSPDARAQQQSLFQALQEAIDNDLTERQRTALIAELKGMPLEEIAEQLGSNSNAIYKLTHDARKKLKKRLEASGYSADDVVSLSAT